MLILLNSNEIMKNQYIAEKITAGSEAESQRLTNLEQDRLTEFIIWNYFLGRMRKSMFYFLAIEAFSLSQSQPKTKPKKIQTPATPTTAPTHSNSM